MPSIRLPTGGKAATASHVHIQTWKWTIATILYLQCPSCRKYLVALALGDPWRPVIHADRSCYRVYYRVPYRCRQTPELAPSHGIQQTDDNYASSMGPFDITKPDATLVWPAMG
jgi:hypothetical protein